MNGRFTPACFPGRTTPDFRHTTSLFEQQGTRASLVSPLTLNSSGSEIIPIAVAFNETVHAYFKMGDQSKFKVKCFGCMKISFPFAILKLLALELPQLEFKLGNLHIANQDLKVNNQLLNRTTLDSNNQSFVSAASSASSPVPSPLNSSTDSLGAQAESLQFQFVTPNLIAELRQQHQQNKQAAFFNFELLKYEFKYSKTPLVLNAQWTSCAEENTIELSLNYVFSFRKNLSQVNFMIVMPLSRPSKEKITLVRSEPNSLVQETENKMQVLWQVPSISSNGKITAKFLIGKVILGQLIF